MTREEALQILDTIPTIGEQVDALELAIKALEQELRDCKTCIHSYKGKCAGTEECHECMWESKYEQEPCEDCISRKAVLDCFKKWQPYMATRIFEYEQELKALPSIQPKPKMGHWEQYGNSWEDKFKCSECGEEQPKILCGERIIGHWSDYCPNCGAKMESEG